MQQMLLLKKFILLIAKEEIQTQQTSIIHSEEI